MEITRNCYTNAILTWISNPAHSLQHYRNWGLDLLISCLLYLLLFVFTYFSIAHQRPQPTLWNEFRKIVPSHSSGVILNKLLNFLKPQFCDKKVDNSIEHVINHFKYFYMHNYILLLILSKTL